MPELVHTAPVTMELRLEHALAAVLRKIGLVGKVAPGAEGLCKIAKDYAEHRNRALSTDQGEVVHVGSCLAPPNPLLDKDIPF